MVLMISYLLFKRFLAQESTNLVKSLLKIGLRSRQGEICMNAAGNSQYRHQILKGWKDQTATNRRFSAITVR